MAIEAKISERGNGFPEPGSYVPDDGGSLYLLVEYVGQIQTGEPGEDHWSHCIVEEADWDDCAPGDEASASIRRMDVKARNY